VLVKTPTCAPQKAHGGYNLPAISLVGGMSWESTAEYYRIINQSVRHSVGPLPSAPPVIYTVYVGPIQEAQLDDRWEDAAAILVEALGGL
jgi:aspartate racemase